MVLQRHRFMDHQNDAFDWCKYREAVALFMEMRCGKTPVAVRWANTRWVGLRKRRILVVSYRECLYGWAEELEREGYDYRLLLGSTDEKERALEEGAEAEVEWYLMNFEGIKVKGGKESNIARLAWDIVIVDESAGIRKPDSIQTKVALKYLSGAPYRACLTGLPNPEGDQDFVCQMLFLYGQFMGCRNFWHWRTEHMVQAEYTWVLKREYRGKILEEARRLSFSITRKQAGMKTKKLKIKRHVDLPQKVQDAIATGWKEFELDGELALYAVQVATWEMRLAGGCWKIPHDEKIKVLRTLLLGELLKEPVIVWARYTDELKRISETLHKHKVQHYLITGETKSDNRTWIDAWRNGRRRVLVCQPKCVDRGNDLSRANYAIRYSRYPDWDINAQQSDRPIHPKKNEPVVEIDIVARDCMDEDQVKALHMKGVNAKLYFNRFLHLIEERLKYRRTS